MPAPRGTTGRAELGADADDVLDLGLRAGPHPGGRPPGRRPFGLVMGQGREHVGIGDDPVAGQGPAQSLEQPACVRLARSAYALR